MNYLNRPGIIEKMNDVIDKRYRQKGYEINYVIFPDKEVSFLTLKDKDKIIKTDITFKTHTTPIKENEYIYPDISIIASQLGTVDNLVVCGFHASDCVKRVANYFFECNINTLVDIELTEYFTVLAKRFYFHESTYNLANIIEYMKGEDIFLHGNQKSYFNIDSLYEEPYYKKDSFTPTIDATYVIDYLENNENKKTR
jgi:hypothetical protein